jgi:hypothetical protein
LQVAKQWTFFVVPIQKTLQKWPGKGFPWMNCGGASGRAAEDYFLESPLLLGASANLPSRLS